jgi:hypothetical protein
MHRVIGWILASAMALSVHLSAFAQAPQMPGTAGASQAESESQYKSCSEGYYNGPRPGRTRYTRDPWMWVVTPEFARRFCFPQEFVSSELKGAEAIAVKVDEDRDEVICGWGDNKEVCRPAWVQWRFEIYAKAGSFPKEKEVPYFHAAKLPSAKLWSRSSEAAKEQWNRAKDNSHIGAIGPFKVDQISLYGGKNGRAVWGMGSLAPEIYYSEVAKGIDFLALSTGMGNLTNSRMQAQGIDSYSIAFFDPSLDRSKRDASLATLPLVINLPTSLIERMRLEDSKRLDGLIRDVRKSIAAPTTSSK